VRQGPDPKKGKGQTAAPAVPVAVGILLRENRILVTRRREGTHLAGSWEFPGGKVQPGEEPEATLRREIEEEVGVRFEKSTLIHRQQHVYSERQVDLYFYLCTGVTGEPASSEGQEIRWVSASDLDHLPTPPANGEVIRMIQDQLG
jgi:8-oxo-dGTP diphosphatase